jgi:hypothetical protein
MKYSAPAAQGGQELNQDRQKSQFSKKPQKSKGFNHLKTLQEIADKWVHHGYYSEPGRAYRALIGGDL